MFGWKVTALVFRSKVNSLTRKGLDGHIEAVVCSKWPQDEIASEKRLPSIDRGRAARDLQIEHDLLIALPAAKALHCTR